MSTVKPIDANTVHKICSGQVITDVASAVKELVENSLDSGATTIEIRFKNYGINSIEVVDNGSGIDAGDYESIGKKHFTSKITDFEDLEALQTFGFRGEALSSLCAVGQVIISTATQNEAPKGVQLNLDHEGSLKDKLTIPFQVSLMQL